MRQINHRKVPFITKFVETEVWDTLIYGGLKNKIRNENISYYHYCFKFVCM